MTSGECPYCPDGHRRPSSKPMAVMVGPERDRDGQPTTLYVTYTAGHHVSEAEADWLRDLIACRGPDHDTSHWDVLDRSAEGDTCPLVTSGEVHSTRREGDDALLTELERTQAKCERLRKEIRAMHEKFDDGQIASLRAQIDAYRRALSRLRFLLDQNGSVEPDELRSIVTRGLACKNLRPGRSRLARQALEQIAAAESCPVDGGCVADYHAEIARAALGGGEENEHE